MLRRLAVTILLMGVFLPDIVYGEEILLQNAPKYEVELDNQVKTLKVVFL